MSNKLKNNVNNLAIDLVLLKDRLDKAGLHKTARAVDQATRVYGEELTEKLTKEAQSK